ncbi:MAG TPA: 23S rRNA (guanosine(2251)-2'-O)-methyltransferase RlmB [Rectinemataceae bacterium]|nr:23S rRNA (guanosine(2251)-2'-O)-methyltransferase RlmB [Rectinemataceae bacterium]
MRRITGFHAIEELFRSGKAIHGRLLISGSGPRIKAILEMAAKQVVPIARLSQAELDRLAPDNRGVAFETDSSQNPAEADLDEFLSEAEDLEESLVLILDHIEDPQNFGAVLRSADVFACDLVIAPKRRAAPLSEAAVRASAGAAAHVPLAWVPNLAEALRRLKKAGYWSYAADMGGDPLPEAELPPKTVLVMGNEGEGVSKLVREQCDGSLAIPQAGHVDSLNVSAATAVMLYEYRRGRPAR